MTADPNGKPDPEEQAQRLAAEAFAAGDPTGWFEKLYAGAGRGEFEVPWNRRAPHPLLVEWAQGHRLDGSGRSAVVVGCGLGEDAEFLASLGFATTAFDLSPSAVAAARSRFADSSVEYAGANLLELPPQWRRSFDFVLESLTVQSLPRSLRQQAIAAVRSLLAPGGTLLVISGALGDDDPDDGPPWRLTRAELDTFAGDELAETDVEQLAGSDGGGSQRWRASFVRG